MLDAIVQHDTTEAKKDMWELLIQLFAVATVLYHVMTYAQLLRRVSRPEYLQLLAKRNLSPKVFLLRQIPSLVLTLLVCCRLYELRRWPAVLICGLVWIAGVQGLVEGFEGCTPETPWVRLSFLVGTVPLVGGWKRLQSGL